MTPEFTKIATVAGTMEAEIIKGLLQSRQIVVWLRRESAGAVYGLGVGPLGQVDIYVATEQREEAEALLDDYYNDRLEQGER